MLNKRQTSHRAHFVKNQVERFVDQPTDRLIAPCDVLTIDLENFRSDDVLPFLASSHDFAKILIVLFSSDKHADKIQLFLAEVGGWIPAFYSAFDGGIVVVSHTGTIRPRPQPTIVAPVLPKSKVGTTIKQLLDQCGVERKSGDCGLCSKTEQELNALSVEEIQSRIDHFANEIESNFTQWRRGLKLLDYPKLAAGLICVASTIGVGPFDSVNSATKSMIEYAISQEPH